MTFCQGSQIREQPWTCKGLQTYQLTFLYSGKFYHKNKTDNLFLYFSALYQHLSCLLTIITIHGMKKTLSLLIF